MFPMKQGGGGWAVRVNNTPKEGSLAIEISWARASSSISFFGLKCAVITERHTGWAFPIGDLAEGNLG